MTLSGAAVQTKGLRDWSSLEGVEETDALLMPIPLYAAAAHRTVEHFRIVADVVVRHGRRPALFSGRFGCIWSKTWIWLFVCRGHDCMRRGLMQSPAMSRSFQ